MAGWIDAIASDVKKVAPLLGAVLGSPAASVGVSLLADAFGVDAENKELLTAAWSIKECLFKWHASAEVDFIKHLVMRKISITDNQGCAECTINREGGIELSVHFLFFNKNCLAWVVSCN